MSSVKSKSKVTHASHVSSAAHVPHVAHNHAPVPSSASPDAVEVVATPPDDVTTQAAKAVAALLALSNTLPIDDAIPPKDLAAAKVTNRVPLKAMQIAAEILTANPGQYPQFDAAEATSSVAYEQAMQPVADNALALSQRITKSILKKRSTNAVQTLALYGTLKSVARLPASESTRGQVKQLTKLFTTNKRPRAEKVTQKELGEVAKGMKKTKVANVKAAKAAVANAAAAEAATAAGIVPPGTASPVSPSVAPAAPASPPAPVAIPQTAAPAATQTP
jgi:hypothetical protein